MQVEDFHFWLHVSMVHFRHSRSHLQLVEVLPNFNFKYTVTSVLFSIAAILVNEKDSPICTFSRFQHPAPGGSTCFLLYLFCPPPAHVCSYRFPLRSQPLVGPFPSFLLSPQGFLCLFLQCNDLR